MLSVTKIDPDKLATSAPKRASVLEQLRHEITSGKLKPSERLPTRPKLEAKFKVSRTTVQEVFDILKNEGFIVSGKTGTYVAKSPPHLGCYGLVFPTDPNGHWRDSERIVPMEAQSVAKRRNCRVTVYKNVAPDYAEGDYANLIGDIRANRLAGVILHHWPHHLYNDPLLQMINMPVVLMPALSPIPNVLHVEYQGELFYEKGIDWLAKKGVSRLGLLNQQEFDPHTAAIIRRIAEQFKMSMHPSWTHFSTPSGAHNLMRLIMLVPPEQRPDGLFILDADLVEPVATGLLAAGARIGQDIHVIAHANLPIWRPSIAPFERIGWNICQCLRICMDIIDAQRRGEDTPSVVQIPPVFEHEITE